MTGEILGAIVSRFGDIRVAVLGEAICDSYVSGYTDRLCPEAPVPVVNVTESASFPGGAANTALNIARLGARVSLVSVVGDDAAGTMILSAMAEGGIDTTATLVDPGRSTLTKRRVMAGDQVLVRCDEGTCAEVEGEIERGILRRLRAAHGACDVLVVSDYGYGVLAPGVIEGLRLLQQADPRVLVVDSKHLDSFRECRPTAVKPNHRQALELLGLGTQEDPARRAETVAEHADEVLERTGARIAAVTLGAEGSLVLEHGRIPYRTCVEARPDSAASGAGDTYLSVFALALATGADTPSAAELASAAADVVVSKRGTSSCSAEELLRRFSEPDPVIDDSDKLARRIAAYKDRGDRVVFTNGCFDILHRGHIAYLERARTLGDVLVVGVNSDDSIRRLKGPKRPINNLDDRIQVLSALGCVDHVVAFGEDTPEELIRVVRPDVFVKGGDYERGDLPEAPLVEELGGIVELLPFEVDRSTTRIIERVRALEGVGTGSA